ncbi:MAG: hypothetical protein V9G19_25575 [Tetrasphaera sp.]
MSMETRLTILGALGVSYGVGFAVLPKAAGWRRFERSYTMAGALLLAALALVFVVIPWLVDTL